MSYIAPFKNSHSHVLVKLQNSACFLNYKFIFKNIIYNPHLSDSTSLLAKRDGLSNTHTKNLLTFSDDDRDCVATLQLPFIRYRQGKLVHADLKTCHRGNSAVCILNLHTVRTPGGGTDGQGHKERM